MYSDLFIICELMFKNLPAKGGGCGWELYIHKHRHKIYLYVYHAGVFFGASSFVIGFETFHS